MNSDIEEVIPLVDQRKPKSQRKIHTGWEVFGIMTAIVLAVVMIVIPILTVRGDLCPNQDFDQPVLIIKDPDITALMGFSLIKSTVMENHRGYSISRALNETASFLIPIYPNSTVIQVTSNFASKSKRINNFKVRDNLPSCLDYKIFQPYGYCFTDLEVSDSQLLITVAWWREPWSLQILVPTYQK